MEGEITVAETAGLEDVLTHPDHLLTFVNSQLELTTVKRTSGTHPLCLLVFLLDATYFLRGHYQDGGQALQSQLPSNTDRDSIRLSPVTECSPHDERPNDIDSGHGGSSMKRQGTNRTFAHEQDWNDWLSFVSEMYVQSVSAEASPTTSEWVTPLYVSQSIIPDLSALFEANEMQSTTGSNKREVLLRCCQSVIPFLYRALALPEPTTLQTEQDVQKLTDPARMDFPVALPVSIADSLCSTLNSIRRGTSGANLSPVLGSSTLRIVIECVLRHFFGDISEKGLATFTEGKPPECLTDSKNVDEEGDEEEENGDIALRHSMEAVQAAKDSIHKRDVKMRWIFGDNYLNNLSACNSASRTPGPFQTPFTLPLRHQSVQNADPSPGSLSAPFAGLLITQQVVTESISSPCISAFDRSLESSPSSSADPSPAGKNRPVSMSSLGSVFTADPVSPNSSFGFPSVRGSHSSSIRPLIEKDSDIKTQQTTPPRRFPFAPQRASSATLLPSATQNKDLPQSLAATVVPIFNPNRPFSDMPEIVGTDSSICKGALSGLSSERVLASSSSLAHSIPHPLPESRSVTVLSPEERSHLIRQHKKLQHILGGPGETATAVANSALDSSPSVPSSRPGRKLGRPRSFDTASLRSYQQNLISSSWQPTSFHPAPSTQSWVSSARKSYGANEIGSSKALHDTFYSGSGSPVSPDFPPNTESPTTPIKEMDEQELQREMRRKKVAKLQTLLGEKVPEHLLLSSNNTNTSAAWAHFSMKASSSASSLSSNASRHGRNLLRRRSSAHSLQIERARRDSAGSIKSDSSFSVSAISGTGHGNHTSSNAASAAMSRTASKLRSGIKGMMSTATHGPTEYAGTESHDFTDGSNGANYENRSRSQFQDHKWGQSDLSVMDTEHVLQDLTRARKLEQVFGNLPPKSLYGNRSFSPMRKPLERGSSASANGSHYPPSVSPTASPKSTSLNELPEEPMLSREQPDKYLDDRSSPLRPRLVSQGSSRSIETFRQSIVSLHYLVEQDPHTLEDTIREVYRDHSEEHVDTSDMATPLAEKRTFNLGLFVKEEEEEDIDEADEDGEPLPLDSGNDLESSSGGTAMARNVSTSSQHGRTIHQAKKLAAFFGTTMGDIWTMLLDDLEAAILEEQDVEDEDREELLRGVRKLRKERSIRSNSGSDYCQESMVIAAPP